LDSLSNRLSILSPPIRLILVNRFMNPYFFIA